MSKQTLFKITYLCLFMISFCILSAQEGDECILPPPSLLEVTEVTTTSISVEWTPVPGAVAYQVVTKETDTGIIVDQTVTPFLSYTINGLTPDTNYTISVSASACFEGPWGPAISLQRSTSIIVVDIVIQLQDCGSTGMFGRYSNKDIHIEDTDSNAETVLVSGVLQGKGMFPANEPFSFVVNTDLVTIKTTGGLNPNMAQKMSISSTGTNIKVLFDDQGTGASYEFAEISITYAPRGSATAKVEIEWKTDVDYVSTSKCATVQFGENEDTAGLRAAESNDIEHEVKLVSEKENTVPQTELSISPNPSSFYINIEGVEKDQVIDVLDLQGRSWYRQMTDGVNTSIDVSNLPSGAYMLRTIIGEKPVVRRFIKV